MCPLMIIAYIRVSTEKQNVANQKFEIERFCQENRLAVDRWVEETISGTTDLRKRTLGETLESLNSGDMLICSELSRLGRSLFMIMDVLSECMRREIRLWTVKENYRLGADIESKVLAFAFGLSAEIERQLISQRTKEALARLRQEGRKLGRPKGSGTRFRVLEGKEKDILRMLEEGESKAEICRGMNVSRSTLYKWLRSNKQK